MPECKYHMIILANGLDIPARKPIIVIRKDYDDKSGV
jgi:hypothetical protein